MRKFFVGFFFPTMSGFVIFQLSLPKSSPCFVIHLVSLFIQNFIRRVWLMWLMTQVLQKEEYSVLTTWCQRTYNYRHVLVGGPHSPGAFKCQSVLILIVLMTKRRGGWHASCPPFSGHWDCLIQEINLLYLYSNIKIYFRNISDMPALRKNPFFHWPKIQI